jgi:hypothetical protein
VKDLEDFIQDALDKLGVELANVSATIGFGTAGVTLSFSAEGNLTTFQVVGNTVIPLTEKST